MEEGDNSDLGVKEVSLIDFSSENDSLILTSSTVISPHLNSSETQGEAKSFELLGDVNTDNVVDQGHTSGQIEQVPQLFETSEPGRKMKNGKCNLRKSLAWDSAFFTSSGVLDPEELTSMIEGTEKGKKHVLPGIEEDMSRSTDSLSTLESENLTLESLEAELFEDIRASIQKSSKASSMANSSRKAASQETDTLALSSSKKVDLGSRSRLKPKASSKVTTFGMERSEKTTKPGSGPQTTQSVSRIRDSASALPRPPMPIGRANNPNRLSMSTTKRASLGPNRVKIESETTKSTTGGSKVTQASKITGLGGPRRAVPKPTPSSKLSSIGSSATTKTDFTRTSSCDSSTSASSGNISKFPSISPRSKIDSIPQTLSKIAPRNKKPEKSTISAHLKLTNLSSSISPASSISEWSSESSSSTSTVNQRSMSRASFETNSSYRSIKSDAPASHVNAQSSDQISHGNRNQVTGLPSQNVKKASTPAGTLSRPPSMKPSGLRMPSPKIGFFDGAKSASKTPNGGVQSQSRLPTGLPKMGPAISSPIGSTNKSKLENKKPNAQKSASSKPFQDPPSASKNISLSSKGVKSHSKAKEDGTEGPITAQSVQDQELLCSIDSCSVLSCMDFGAKQQSIEGQKEELIGTRTPFTVKNSLCGIEGIEFSRETSIEVVEKIAILPSMEIGLKENS
ncbi:hypothetical protein LguiB_015720 [Lonicera macranthoides]